MKRCQSFIIGEAELPPRICRFPAKGIKIVILVSTSILTLGKYTIPTQLLIVVKKATGSIVSLDQSQMSSSLCLETTDLQGKEMTSEKNGKNIQHHVSS